MFLSEEVVDNITVNDFSNLLPSDNPSESLGIALANLSHSLLFSKINNSQSLTNPISHLSLNQNEIFSLLEVTNSNTLVDQISAVTTGVSLLSQRYLTKYFRISHGFRDINYNSTKNANIENILFKKDKSGQSRPRDIPDRFINKFKAKLIYEPKSRDENRIVYKNSRTENDYLFSNSIPDFSRPPSPTISGKSKTALKRNSKSQDFPVQDDGFPEEELPYIFDRAAVKVSLIVLFSIVFITGLVGNLLVLVVMYLHPRMKSTTNFFLTNLAIADLCVTVFCVLQNLSLYLAHSWVFGDMMCKMYSFVHHLSYTSSVMILVVNCFERYLAIMRPFKAKTVLRQTNLFISLALVWLLSGVYCCPKLIFFKAVEHRLENDEVEVICLADRELYNSKIYDTINFFFLYLLPLCAMSVFYFKIARYLWINGSQIESQLRHDLATTPRQVIVPENSTAEQLTEQRRYFQQIQKEQYEYENRPLNVRSNGSNSSSGRYSFKSGRIEHAHKISTISYSEQPTLRIGPYHSYVLIRTWRKVVTLLIAVVLSFAICNLPFHLRKMVSYYYSGYEAFSDISLLATPITNLLTYLNSALNPILYSFMSHNFRCCVKDVLSCKYDIRGKRKSSKNKFVFALNPLRCNMSDKLPCESK